MIIELEEHTAQRIRELAAMLHKTPETVASEAMTNGTILIQRYAKLKARSESADVSKPIAFLNRPSNNPPDSGDELHEGW